PPPPPPRAVGPAQLRQGPARPDRPHRPPGGAGPVHERTSGGARVTAMVDTQLDVAARVLDLVRAMAGAAAEAEVLVDRTELALTRFANSYTHQNVAASTVRVRLRLHLDGRTAVGSATGVDGLSELVDRTVTASRLS